MSPGQVPIEGGQVRARPLFAFLPKTASDSTAAAGNGGAGGTVDGAVIVGRVNRRHDTARPAFRFGR